MPTDVDGGVSVGTLFAEEYPVSPGQVDEEEARDGPEWSQAESRVVRPGLEQMEATDRAFPARL
ncbi:hypothetical protein [Enterovirga sp. CN4-39]|uniref:hypothetical protein n=1 Tax=Enterovirga sp. CN4-39 TaxID=3400910 RepID=UPI003BFC6BB5